MRNLYVALCGLLIVASAMIFAGCEKDNSTVGEYNQEQELYDWNEFFQDQNAGFVNRVVIVDSVGHTNPLHDTADMKVGDELWKHKHSYSINLAIIHNSLIKLPRNHIDTDKLMEVIHYSIDHQWPISIDIYQGVIMRATILTEEQVNYWKQSSDGKSFYEQIRMQQYLVPVDELVSVRSYSKYFSSYAQVSTVFNYLKQANCLSSNNFPQCIPFQYKQNGCYARAHLMKKYMEEGYSKTCDKVFLYGTLNSGCVDSWRWHVAPLVYVGSTKYVLDPSVANNPVTLNQWRNIITLGSQYSYCDTEIVSGFHYTPNNHYCGYHSYVTDPSYAHASYVCSLYENNGTCDGGSIAFS